MKTGFVLLGITAVLLSTPAAHAETQQQLLDAIDGQGRIIAADGSDLGLVSSSRYLVDSICNPMGSNGSSMAYDSIWNTMSPYGDRMSETSAYNPRATKPPLMMFTDGSRIFVSKNPKLRALDPDRLRQVMCR
jgi:hypothetical protein